MDKEQLLDRISRDKRTPNQVFASLRDKIIAASGGKMSEGDATVAARKLIRIFEIALKIPEERRSIEVDDGAE